MQPVLTALADAKQRNGFLPFLRWCN